MLTQLVAFQGGFATGFGAGLKVRIPITFVRDEALVFECWNFEQAGKWGSKSYASAYNAGYAAGVLREQKKELHAQQMMQVMPQHIIMRPFSDCDIIYWICFSHHFGCTFNVFCCRLNMRFATAKSVPPNASLGSRLAPDACFWGRTSLGCPRYCLITFWEWDIEWNRIFAQCVMRICGAFV
jgi:hypothetical protein